MVAKRQVPADEPAAHTLEERGDGLFPIFGFGHHSLDGIGREPATGDVDGHGVSPPKRRKLPVVAPFVSELYAHSQTASRPIHWNPRGVTKHASDVNGPSASI